MNKFYVKFFKEYRAFVLFISMAFLLFLVSFKSYFYNLNFDSLLFCTVNYLIAVDVLYNGSYMFLSKLTADSDKYEYFNRIFYMTLFYIGCIYGLFQ